MGIAERTFTTVKAAHDALVAEVRKAPGGGKVFIHRGDATGDQTHIGPVVARHANRGVLVIGFPGAGEKGLGIATTYLNGFRVPEERVAYVFFQGRFDVALKQCKPLSISRVLFTDALGEATTDVADDVLVKGATRTWVKETLRGPKFIGATVLAPDSFEVGALNWLTQTKRIPLDRHCVVLWGRRSGERGGSYPKQGTTGASAEEMEWKEGMYPLQDHNGRFMKALAEACLAAGHTVLCVGDFPRAEFGEAVADTWQGGNTKAVFLGDYWNHCPGVTDRQKQVRLFYVLWKTLRSQNPSRSLVHCGARSGGLDAYGFAGQPMIYIVGGNQPDARMKQKVVDRFAAGKLAGTLLSYNFHDFRLANTPRRRIARSNPPEWEDNAFAPGEVQELRQRIVTLLDTTTAS